MDNHPVSLLNHDYRVLSTPLANRLKCMYMSLTKIIGYTFPVFSRPLPSGAERLASDLKETIVLTVPDICSTILPVLADVCATGNVYRLVANKLNVGSFDEMGFARATAEDFNDNSVDGLDSGVILTISCISLITLAGVGGDMPTVLATCLQMVQPFLRHPAWKSRGVGLLLLRNLVVLNLPAFWPSQNDTHANGGVTECVENYCCGTQMRNVVVEMLSDPVLEVSHLAMRTLAALIQTGLVSVSTPATWVCVFWETVLKDAPKIDLFCTRIF